MSSSASHDPAHAAIADGTNVRGRTSKQWQYVDTCTLPGHYLMCCVLLYRMLELRFTDDDTCMCCRPKRQGSDDSRHTALLDLEEASGRIHRRTSSGASDRALTSAAPAGTSSDPLGDEPVSEPTDSETAPFVRRHRS